MIIGIDMTALVYSGSGVANYTYNLVKNLLEIDKKNEYRLFYSSFRRPKNFYYLDELRTLGAKVYEYRFPPSLLELCWSKFNIFPVEWFIGRVDIFFSSDYLRPPLLLRTIGITTVHDLVWKLYPEFHVQKIIDAHERKLEKTLKYDDTVLVDSKNTKSDLEKLYPKIKKERIQVLYPGVREDLRPIKDKPKILNVLNKYQALSNVDRQLSIVPNFILYVGAIEPRKNLDKAIRAFSKLSKAYQFFITGKMGWKNDEIFSLVKKLKLTRRVKFLSFVEDEDLPYFYASAKLLLYLSSYEGFGLPPLEAIACGTKVLAGDNSSMRETIDKKFLVDVDNENAIFKKIEELLRDKTPVDYKKIKEVFNWKVSAEKLLEIISSMSPESKQIKV